MPSRRIALEPLLEQIHDAALGTRSWEAMLDSMTKLLRVNSAVITVEWRRGGGWGFSTGGDARTHADYFQLSSAPAFSPDRAVEYSPVRRRGSSLSLAPWGGSRQ